VHPKRNTLRFFTNNACALDLAADPAPRFNPPPRVSSISAGTKCAVNPAVPQETNPRLPVQRYFFYEKTTGSLHFNVEAGPDGQFPLDHAAAMLAMHCMVRGQSPADYVVMVPAATDSFGILAEKAEKLLRAGYFARSPISLTRREEEVLAGIMRSLANKEIAASLNLSERTIKLHVSALFAKFRVRRRGELLTQVRRLIMPHATLAPT